MQTDSSMSETPHSRTHGGTTSVVSDNSCLFIYQLLANDRRVTSHRGPVFCLTMDGAVHGHDLQENVCCLELETPSDCSPYIAGPEMIALVDCLAQDFMTDTPIRQWLKRSYASTDIDFYFRRVLLEYLGDLIVLLTVMRTAGAEKYERIELGNDFRAIKGWEFIIKAWHQPSRREQLARSMPGALHPILDRLSIRSRDGFAIKLAVWMYAMAAPWLKLIRRVRFRPRRMPCALVMLRSYATDWDSLQGAVQRLRQTDFLVDGHGIQPDNVLVWAESGVPHERIEAYRRRGYRTAQLADLQIGIGRLLALLPTLLSWLAVAGRVPRVHRGVAGHVIVLVWLEMLWSEVMRQVQPRAFVAYNDLPAASVPRNLVMRRHGCTSIAYQHSSGAYNPFTGNHEPNVLHPYMVFDVIATWGPAHTRQLQCHPLAVQDYWDVGCLWSEYARRIRDEAPLRTMYENQLQELLGSHVPRFEKQIGVFDGTPDENSREDWIGFYEGIDHLSVDMPDVLFLIKPKNPFDWFSEVVGIPGRDVWQRLEARDNVLVLPVSFETSAIVALTDAGIGQCFTSVTLESIGCGMPCVYFDPTDHYPQAFWHDLPGMICVTVAALAKRMRGLLASDRVTYNSFLQEHCADIEGHFDGLGISRLRERVIACTSQ